MGRYCAAHRYAYQRLRQPVSDCTKGVGNELPGVDGQRALDIEKQVATRFGLNSRYAKDAVHEAVALIAAQNALVRLRVREWQRKLQGAKRKQKSRPLWALR